ncbi:MAG: DUF928 domain-containing protein [Cyanobacteria bacterium P01_D01_bin.71]
MKDLFQLRRVGAVLPLSLLLGSSLLAALGPAIAQDIFQVKLPDISAPGNRESGSTRSTTCIAPNDNLVALMPQTNYGFTQNAYPTIYFYLPPTTAEQVKFVLLNESTNELIYESRFGISDRSGIASISLPDNGIQQPLEVGEAYVWYIAVVCEPTDPSADVVTEGQIARVESLPAVATATAETLPAVYAEAGLWFDALAAAATLKQDDNAVAWDTLLEAVELNELIPVELLDDSPSSTAQATILTP